MLGTWSNRNSMQLARSSGTGEHSAQDIMSRAEHFTAYTAAFSIRFRCFRFTSSLVEIYIKSTPVLRIATTGHSSGVAW